MGFTEDDHVVETLASNTSDEPLHEWILPGTLCSPEHFFYSHSLNPASEQSAVDGVPIPQQIAWRRVFRKRFDDLPRRPIRGWMLGHIKMDNPSSLMCQHNKDKQDSELQRRYREEVDGDELTNMIGQESLPGLGWSRSLLWHQA